MNAAKQNPRTASEMPRPSKSERILVVKEEETIREIIASMLTRAGYECQESGDGLEALALLDSSKGFDLLLAGLSMPNLDGIALLERTKAKYPDLPVVIVAVHNVRLALLALHSGAYEYLFKPFEEEQLLATVRRALEYRRLKLANRGYKKELGILTIPAAHEERILLQDDEETIREIVSSMLRGSHYECRAVASPKEALDMLRSGEQFDLVICGLLETLEDNFFKRMGEQFPDIPLVVLSACHGFHFFLPALRDGAYDYLMKPFEREELLIVVRRALEYRNLKLENSEYKAKLGETGETEIPVG